MEICYFLIVYIFITQPTTNYPDETLKKLYNIIGLKRSQEIQKILLDNQIIIDPKISHLQKFKAIQRQIERLNIYLPDSIFEAPAFPTLKQLSQTQIYKMQSSTRHWFDRGATYQQLLRKLDTFAPSFRTELGLNENDNITPLVSWINFSSNSAPIAELIEIAINAIEQKNLCYKDMWGITLLHVAALLGNAELVKLLLNSAAKANLNTKDKCGNSPLHYALEAKDSQNAWLLLEAGAITSISNELGMSPLHLAAYYGQAHLVQAFLDRGEPVDAFGESSALKVSEILEDITLAGVWIKRFPYMHLPAFTYLCRKLCENIAFEPKIEIGYEVHGIMFHFTPLYWAVHEQHKVVIELLVQHGANIYGASKFYKISSQSVVGNDTINSSKLFDIASSEMVIVLAHACLKKELMQIIQHIKECPDSDTLTIRDETLQRFRSRYLQKPNIDVLFADLELNEDIPSKVILRAKQLIEELYLQPLSPNYLISEPQAMQHFLYKQWLTIQKDLQQIARNSNQQIAITTYTHIKEFIDKLDLTSLIECYVYYRRNYLRGQQINRKGRNQTMPILLMCMCFFPFVFFLYSGLKGNFSQPMSRFMIFQHISVAIIGWFLPAFIAAYRCYADIYLDVPEKISLELEELDKNYRIFIDNPLISILTQKDLHTTTQNIIITIPEQMSSNTFAKNRLTDFFFNPKKNKKECEAKIKNQSHVTINIENNTTVLANHKYKWV